LKEYVKVELRRVFWKVLKKYPSLQIVAMNVDEDHIHLQIEIPPNIAVSRVVQVLKSESSKCLRRKFKFIRRMYLGTSIWSVGYFSSTIGLNEKLIAQYIQAQGKKEIPKQVGFEFS